MAHITKYEIKKNLQFLKFQKKDCSFYFVN